MVARAYLLAVEDCDDLSIKVAAEEYLKGKVTNHDGRFAPSTAQFAERVRLHDKIAEGAIRRIQQKPEALLELAPEYQAQMRERMRAMNLTPPRLIASKDWVL